MFSTTGRGARPAVLSARTGASTSRPRGEVEGQVGDAVGATQGQGVPALVPRAARTGAGVEHDEASHPATAQLVGGGQARLSGADDDDVDGCVHVTEPIGSVV